jgi:hypothetical protein
MTNPNPVRRWRRRWALYAHPLGQYMRRYIFKHPRGTVRLHNIRQSDEGRDFHDHPWEFTSLILWGGYVEHRPGCDCAEYIAPWIKAFWKYPNGACRYYGPGSIVRVRAEDFHRLELVNGPAWTLVVTGPYRRNWGFQTRDGWICHEDYHRSYYQREKP